jgi:hypothetical protein
MAKRGTNLPGSFVEIVGSFGILFRVGKAQRWQYRDKQADF